MPGSTSPVSMVSILVPQRFAEGGSLAARFAPASLTRGTRFSRADSPRRSQVLLPWSMAIMWPH